MKLIDLLNTKDLKYRNLVTVKPNDTISTAIQKLAEHDRGSLPVCNDKSELVGIITERDIVRKCFIRRDDMKNIMVKEIMSQNVVIGNPDDDLSYAIKAMQEKRIRHVPIVDNKKVIGMISMRDLIGVQLEECKMEVRFLNDYISGRYTPSITP